MTQRIVIIGAGGLGREFIDVIDAINFENSQQSKPKKFELIGFLDDGNPVVNGDSRVKILGRIDRFEALDKDVQYVIGIGDVDARKQIDEQITDLGYNAAVLIHPQASIGQQNVKIEGGTVVCANASLTTNIALGRHVHINLNTTVGHDSVIGAYVSANPGVNISGNVIVGESVMFGTGSTVLQGLEIGQGSTIGANALVTKNIAENVIAVGIPAKSYNK